jgi:hypothetical protein
MDSVLIVGWCPMGPWLEKNAADDLRIKADGYEVERRGRFVLACAGVRSHPFHEKGREGWRERQAGLPGRGMVSLRKHWLW